MTEKRYFKREWEEEYYIFDSTNITEEKFDKEVEYGYDVFADSMQGDEVVDRLNEQENKLNQIKKLCMENRIPVCLTAHIPRNCEHYHACFENHTENAVSFGESKIANEILKIISGDV